MVGQIYTFNFNIEDKCDVDIEVTINNNKCVTVDETHDLIQQISEELYYSIINISENQ